MIEVTETLLMGAPWFEVWSHRGHLHAITSLAAGRSLEHVLIQAEKTVRTDLDDLQARLHAVRERVKAEASVG